MICVILVCNLASTTFRCFIMKSCCSDCWKHEQYLYIHFVFVISVCLVFFFWIHLKMLLYLVSRHTNFFLCESFSVLLRWYRLSACKQIHMNCCVSWSAGQLVSSGLTWICDSAELQWNSRGLQTAKKVPKCCFKNVIMNSTNWWWANACCLAVGIEMA